MLGNLQIRLWGCEAPSLLRHEASGVWWGLLTYHYTCSWTFCSALREEPALWLDDQPSLREFQRFWRWHLTKWSCWEVALLRTTSKLVTVRPVSYQHRPSSWSDCPYLPDCLWKTQWEYLPLSFTDQPSSLALFGSPVAKWLVFKYCLVCRELWHFRPLDGWHLGWECSASQSPWSCPSESPFRYY